jgi:hypothetical protein
MNKIKLYTVVFITCFLSFNVAVAQNGNRNLGFGLQSSFPTYGLSAKIGVSDQLLCQAIVAPFSSAKSSTFSYTMNFYGVRANYRLSDPESTLVPYGFVGTGVIRSTYNFMGSKSSSNYLGWNIGAGLEFFPNFLDNLGASAELGYGSMNINTLGTAVRGVSLGLGLHYYVK